MAMQKRFTVVLFLGMAVVASADPLSLKEAIQRARQNNPQIQANKAGLERTESEKTEAFSRFMPELTVSGKVTKIDDPITIDLRSMRTAILGSNYGSTYTSVYTVTQPTLGEAGASSVANASATAGQQALAAQLPEDEFEIQVQDDLFFNATASLVWPIFTGGRIFSAYQAASENVDAQKAAYDAKENAVLMEVCSRYFTLRLAEELTALRDTTRTTLEQHVEQAKKLESGGQISRAERLRAEVALAEAENEWENAKRDLSLSRLALANTIGGDTAVSTVTPIQSVTPQGSLESYKQRALEIHPGLRQLRMEKKRSERAVTVARGEYFPTIALFGQKELYTNDLTILQPEWAVGVNMEWNLFHGGETAGKVASAKATEREVQSLENKATEDISLLVEKRWRELEYAQGRLVSLKKTEELADESLEDQKKAFDAGVATSLDVVDAQLALSRLKVAMLQANYQSMIALAGLLETSGEVDRISEILEK